MNFVAIDFETANEQRFSPCSIGLVVVKNGIVVEKISRFIRPLELRFSPICVQKHGIRPEQVKDEPEFPAVWNDLCHHVENNVFVAHNAPFDMDVLSKTLSIYEMPYPDIVAYCTMNIAKTVWPESKYGLQDIASQLGIEFQHHVAEEDARVCAEIAIHVCKEKQASSIEELASLLHISPMPLKFYEFDGKTNIQDDNSRNKITYRSRLNYANQKICLKDIIPETANLDTAHPLFGCSVVFTGTLTSMGRQEAMQKLANRGGILSNSISKKIDYLVIGDGYPNLCPPTTSKIKKAFELKEDGCKIEIIGENEFLRLLGH
jgi:DNA polymerase-3 subunit epsilon